MSQKLMIDVQESFDLPNPPKNKVLRYFWNLHRQFRIFKWSVFFWWNRKSIKPVPSADTLQPFTTDFFPASIYSRPVSESDADQSWDNMKPKPIWNRLFYNIILVVAFIFVFTTRNLFGTTSKSR